MSENSISQSLAESPLEGVLISQTRPAPSTSVSQLFPSLGDHSQHMKRKAIGRYTLQTPPPPPPATLCESISHHSSQNMTNEATDLQPLLQEANIHTDF